MTMVVEVFSTQLPALSMESYKQIIKKGK
ncbi:unnamed protein product [Larinioides sclopetarius]|uniref:Uncharacterized protein n=1 Tax=Larinioides sclopetarius TaxID=280406 RepID=A0AAV2A2H4_9ARAC